MNSHVAVRALLRRSPRLSVALSNIGKQHSKCLPTSSYKKDLSSSTEGSSPILGRSTVLLQDGLDIRELPMVIRRMNGKDFPFSGVFYSGENLRPVTEEDQLFKFHLQECNDLEDVLKLLEVPGERVTANSAAFALQRLCQLREGLSDRIDSFIKKAVFNELCETATKEIENLNTDSLITLVKCYLNSQNVTEDFKNRVNGEIERRVGDGALSINDLCTLIQLLALNLKGDHSIVNNMWIHLGNRFQDINQHNISLVYSTLKYISPEYRYLCGLVDKQLERCWWKLVSEDMSLIVKSMTALNHDNVVSLKAIGKWMSVNGHDLQHVHLLRHLLTMYLHFSYSEPNLIRSLEMFLPAKVSSLDKTVLAMIMEYCRRKRFCPTKIFESIASDFEQNGDVYKSHEIVYCLRPFGQLNYTPKNAGRLFTKIEEVLEARFAEIDASAILELLASFSYIGRLPINFMNQIFSPHFVSRLQNAENKESKKASSFHLQVLRSALLLESPNMRVNFVNWHVLGRHSTIVSGRWHKFHLDLGRVLVGLLRSTSVLKSSEIPRHLTYFVDYEIGLNKGKIPIDMAAQKSPPNKIKQKGLGKSMRPLGYFPLFGRLAILTVMPEHCVLNTTHLLGEHATKVRQLALMGYTPILIFYDEYMWHCRTPQQKDDYLKGKLRKHINFEML